LFVEFCWFEVTSAKHQMVLEIDRRQDHGTLIFLIKHAPQNLGQASVAHILSFFPQCIKTHCFKLFHKQVNFGTQQNQTPE